MQENLASVWREQHLLPVPHHPTTDSNSLHDVSGHLPSQDNQICLPHF